MTEHTFFAARLRELREQAGLSQQQLAEKTGMSQRGISQIERGEREPGWQSVVALAKALEVSLDEFIKQPASSEPRHVGRPRKQPVAEPAPKKPRGRPRKEPE